MTYQLETLKSKLIAAHLKATQQRIVIYEAVMKLNNHPTADQVYGLIKPANPSISLGTVYKTLDSLVNHQLICRVMTDDGFMRYDAHTESHNHIYCVNTQEIIDFTDPELQQLMDAYFKRKKIHNLKIKDISVQINAEKINPEEAITIE